MSEVKRRMLGYVRVSPHPDSKQNPSESPENQELALKKAAERMGGQYVHTYVDRDRSAYTLPFAKRPAANQLLRDACPGDMVLVVSLDRLERGGSRRMFNMLDAFQRKRLGLYALREFGERRVANDSAIDEALLSLWAFSARWEAEQARKRAHEMHAARKARNLRHSRYPPIGHRHVEKPHPEKPNKTVTVIEPDPIDASICVEIWRRRKAGWSFPMIADRLGLRDRKGVGGVPWVRRMKSGNSYERLRQAYAAVETAAKEEDNMFAGIPLDGALNGLTPPFCGGSFSLPEWLPH